MKNAVFILGVLIAISCVLLERGDACYNDHVWQTVGDMKVPDPACTTPGAQCRLELVQISWDNSANTFDWVYLPANCTACPGGGTPATCGQ
jgi:hypothetical protein